MNPEEKSFNQILEEALQSRSLTIEKLAELTGVPLKFVVAIKKADLAKLPPAPYVRGYVVKISEFLELKSEDLWTALQRDAELRISGLKDKMPGNRYAQKPLRKGLFFGIALLILLIFYSGYRLNKLTGRPELQVKNPIENTIFTSSPIIIIEGTLDNKSKLSINNERVNVRDDGSWEKRFSLQSGLNTVEIKAEKILGRETGVIKQVIYTPSPTPIEPPTSTNPML